MRSGEGVAQAGLPQGKEGAPDAPPPSLPLSPLRTINMPQWCPESNSSPHPMQILSGGMASRKAVTTPPSSCGRKRAPPFHALNSQSMYNSLRPTMPRVRRSLPMCIQASESMRPSGEGGRRRWTRSPGWREGDRFLTPSAFFAIY